MPIGYNFVVSEGGDDPSSEINESKDDDTLKIGSELPIIAIIGRTMDGLQLWGYLLLESLKNMCDTLLIFVCWMV